MNVTFLVKTKCSKPSHRTSLRIGTQCYIFLEIGHELSDLVSARQSDTQP